MGFFSWITSDSQESIANRHTPMRSTFEVRMVTPDGQEWVENNYDGYGIFGGKDYYELLAELNGKKTRDEGIGIAFKNNSDGDNTPGVIYPKLFQYKKSKYNNYPNSRFCPDQGFFYANDEVDEVDDNWDEENGWN